MGRVRQRGGATVALAAALLVVAPQAGTAGGKVIGPPYAGSSAEGDCYSEPYLIFDGACHATPVADPATGALGLDLGITAPLDGRLSGYGHAYAYAELRATDTLDNAVAAVTYTVTLHLNSASVSYSAPPDAIFGGGYPYASAGAFAYASHSGCGSCSSGDWRQLLDLDSGPTTRSGEDITFELALVNCTGFFGVPPGDVAITVGTYGYESLSGPGTVQTSIDAVVPAIAVEVDHGPLFGPRAPRC